MELRWPSKNEHSAEAVSGLDKISFVKQSLYFVLRESYGVRVAWADEVIRHFQRLAKNPTVDHSRKQAYYRSPAQS
jgi:hypothetical protein